MPSGGGLKAVVSYPMLRGDPAFPIMIGILAVAAVTEIYLTNLLSAQRQLCAAIRMFFLMKMNLRSIPSLRPHIA